MSLTAIKNKVTSKVGRQVLITRKHSPALLFGVGTVGVVTTVVLACRATLKMEEVLAEAEKQKAQIGDAIDMDTDQYDEKDASKDSATVRVQTAVRIGKLYAPAFAVGIISIGALTGSHIILSRRNVALTAAYAALDKGFKDYRKRVVDEFGQDKDDDLRSGVIEREIAVDTDEGVAVKTVRERDRNGLSVYAKLFSRETSVNWSPDPGYNQTFLRVQQSFANDLLNARGHLFLNEVYDALHLDRTPAGQAVGWVKGNGDGFVDFGFMRDLNRGQDFINGNERSIWLDFNVDGVVYDLI